MNEAADVALENLVAMSRQLGQPENDYVILGDGNTSARIDEETFWVKASGFTLHGIGPDGFTRIRFAPIMSILDQTPSDDEDIKKLLSSAKVDPASRHPSIETVFHALALTYAQARYVGHTHPVALNAILCSQNARQALNGHLFSESALYLGPQPIIVPYADPGLPLARRLKIQILDYLDRFGQPPRVFYLLNHGLVALGGTPQEVENITAMTVKAARILLGAYAVGGPNFLDRADVERICARPDEEYRRRMANEGKI